MDSNEIFDIFNGQNCPGCGGRKNRANAFCVSCFRSLPYKMRQDLYKRFGSGFEEAFETALAHLKAKEVK